MLGKNEKTTKEELLESRTRSRRCYPIIAFRIKSELSES